MVFDVRSEKTRDEQSMLTQNCEQYSFNAGMLKIGARRRTNVNDCSQRSVPDSTNGFSKPVVARCGPLQPVELLNRPRMSRWVTLYDFKVASDGLKRTVSYTR